MCATQKCNGTSWIDALTKAVAENEPKSYMVDGQTLAGRLWPNENRDKTMKRLWSTHKALGLKSRVYKAKRYYWPVGAESG